MLKISIVKARGKQRLVLEGKLMSPWTDEVENTWKNAPLQLDGGKPIIDLSNVTLISRDGENTLLKLMRNGAKFSGGDVLTNHVLKRVAGRCRCGQ